MKKFDHADLFIMNNCSYQSGGKDSNRTTYNKVDNIKVAVNSETNDFFELKLPFQEYIGKSLESNDDLYINSLHIESFDSINGLSVYNLIAEIRSQSNRELLNEWHSFKDNILVYNHESDSFDIVNEKESNVKRVYPLVIQTDENNFIMWHNFYSDSVHINKNPSGKYVMHLVTPRTHAVIATMLTAKFGSDWLHVADSIEELVDMFYRGFV